MARRYLATAVVLAAASVVMNPTGAQASPPGTKDVTAVLFEWNFASVARECTTTLGPAGYGYVQVSPPAEHIQGSQWWTSYQPVSYKIAGRLGDRSAFKNMVDTCHAAGVKVVVDTVINHMSAGSGTGTGGSSYTKYNYPGLYSSYDFDNCTSEINNYGDRWNVQNCELVGLADLDTGEDYVRGAIAGYMNDLLSLGVDGFRIDAAKHIAAADLANIKSRLNNPSAYWKQEVIYGAGEAVQPTEYTGTGDVQEFRYAYDLKRVFNNENLAYLKNYGEGWGYLNSGSAGVFVDNHDTERNGSTLSYANGAELSAATAIMLASDYGPPTLYSGYAFSDRDQGPALEADGSVADASCTGDEQPDVVAGAGWEDRAWVCQHRWPGTLELVAWRTRVVDAPVTATESHTRDGFRGAAVSIARGDTGVMIVNVTEHPIQVVVPTELADGRYCDIVLPDCAPVVVDYSEIHVTLQPWQTVALDRFTRP